MKVLILAKDEKMEFVLNQTANLSYDQKCFSFGDLTNVPHHLILLSLVQRLRYVHHSQARAISYTFLVADYWLSPHLATALLHCSTFHASTALFLED